MNNDMQEQLLEQADAAHDQLGAIAIILGNSGASGEGVDQIMRCLEEAGQEIEEMLITAGVIRAM